MDKDLTMTQDEIFWEGEADSWFKRNAAALGKNNDPITSLLQQSSLRPKQVLEIGCSNGYRLHKLASLYNCSATGIEPSQAAISDGRRRYPNINLLRGLSHNLPIKQHHRFDLVIVNFVLHWVDRSKLLATISEIDRMIADNGYLLLGDFYPPSPEQVIYHHLPDKNVWTYKQNYVEIFLASKLYDVVAFLTLDYTTKDLGIHIENPSNRSQVALLRKDTKLTNQIRE